MTDMFERPSLVREYAFAPHQAMEIALSREESLAAIRDAETELWMIDPAAPRRHAAGWFTSSYSNANGACVEVRFDRDNVQVADSKDRGAGPVITVTGAEWDAFVATALGAPSDPGAALTSTSTTAGGRMVVGPGQVSLRFTAAEWAAFPAGAADGEFVRPRSAGPR